jgi:16S rRNA (adenine1518-N6/adenine1519-N6)-dimethyltransferase
MKLMDLTSKRVVRQILAEKGIKPSKRFGQHFLISQPSLNRIIELSKMNKKDVVLEIGAGLGALTQGLAQKAKRVIAVEKDKRLVEFLNQTFDPKRVKIVQGDILTIDFKDLGLKNYKVVSNLPFNITSLVIKKLLEQNNPPKSLLLMIQKEVAQRICAKPPRMNPLAVLVQFYAEPKVVCHLSKNNFWPKPDVNAALVLITPLPKMKKVDPKLFFKITKAGFAHPRKFLANNLGSELKLEKEKIKVWLLKNGIDVQKRAQSLSLENWLNLAGSFHKFFV